MNIIKSDSDNFEPVIKDLLYEASAREKLNSREAKGFSKNLPYSIAAVAATLLILLAAFQFVPGISTMDYNGIAAQEYEFPSFYKSRSNNQPLIDQYLPSIKSKNYEQVLAEILKQEAKGVKLSEQDHFIKAHLLFVTNSLDDAKQLIKNTRWQDEFIIGELSWLSFLIDFRKKSSKASLQERLELLPLKYKNKARRMLMEIK